MGQADRLAKRMTDAVLDRVASQSRPGAYVPPAGAVVRPARATRAVPLELSETARPLPPMRPLEVMGSELYPAVDMPVRSRVRRPGMVYEDEIEAIDAVMPSLQEDMRRGLEAGYGQWYFTGPLQERFRSVLGRDRGDREFRRFMGLTSASSNASPVQQEIKKGSLLYNLHKQGLLPEAASYEEAVERIRRAREEGLIPQGYGGFAQGQDLYKANQYLQGRLQFPGDEGAGARYKLGDYYNQKLGDPDAAAMDSWMHRWLGLPFESRAYSPARQAILHAAGDVPISQAQPAIWMMRGARSPAMRSLDYPSFLHGLENRLKQRAKQLGEPPEKVLDDVIRGRQYMYRNDSWAEGMA
jgi:hypothetical protein